MKKLVPWLIAAFAGFTFMFLLNASPLAHEGMNIKLPLGWHNAEAQKFVACLDHIGKSEGLPLAATRPSAVKPCLFDTNNIAMPVNYLFGILLLPLLIFIIDKTRNKKQE
jgi:hypothetical protein